MSKKEVRLEALTRSMLETMGVLTREGVARAVQNRADISGFGGIYPVLKAMEEVGRVRRGYFVGGLGATQFALPGSEGRLREERLVSEGEDPHIQRLAADDPASPYGASLPWPERPNTLGVRPSRRSGARVILVDGRALAFVGATGQRLCTFLPREEPTRTRFGRLLAAFLSMGEGRGAAVFRDIDGMAAAESPFAAFLLDAGFRPTPDGLHRRFGEHSVGPSNLS